MEKQIKAVVEEIDYDIYKDIFVKNEFDLDISQFINKIQQLLEHQGYVYAVKRKSDNQYFVRLYGRHNASFSDFNERDIRMWKNPVPAKSMATRLTNMGIPCVTVKLHLCAPEIIHEP